MERHTVSAAETLAKAIIANYANPLQSSSIDVPAHVESLLQSLGATASDSGGKVTYYGSDPITPECNHARRQGNPDRKDLEGADGRRAGHSRRRA
jgi:hypothetical protein